MRISRPAARPKSEGTITLINVVFLMLIFFLIAGNLTPPLDNEVQLINSETGEPLLPPDTLSVRANGELFFRGNIVTPEAFLAGLREGDQSTASTVRIIADKELPAVKLIDLVANFRKIGAGRLHVVTQRTDP